MGLPRLIAEDWRALTGPDADLLLTRLKPTMGVQAALVPLESHWQIWLMKPSCYPGHLLVELEVSIDGQPAAATFLYGPGGIVPITGQSVVFHDLNAEAKLDIGTADAALLYLQLFSNGVHGDEGRFRTIATLDEIPWDPKLAPQMRPALALPAPADPLRIEDRWELESAILYGSAMFHARFAVTLAGMVEMIDDTPLGSELPIQQESFKGPFRTLQPPKSAA